MLLKWSLQTLDDECHCVQGMDASSGWIPESAQFEVLPLDELQATDSVSLCRRETLPLFRQFERLIWLDKRRVRVIWLDKRIAVHPIHLP